MSELIADTDRPGGDRRPQMPTLVGRDRELALLARSWDAACLGSPQTVLVEGPAGIGKTVLLDTFTARLASSTVLRVSGDEGETSLSLAVVDQLLRNAGDAAPGMLADPDDPGHRVADHINAGTRVLRALDGLQSAGPVLIAVDDAHWVDGPSLAALLFAIRRLGADRVLVLFAARDDELSVPSAMRRAACGSDGATVRLGALDAWELRALAATLGVRLTPRVADRLLAHTAGNPLYARALLAELPADAWLNPDALPAPRSYAALVAGRAERCSAQCLALVEAVAVLGSGCALEQAARLAAIDDELGALDEAVSASLLVESWRGGAHAVVFSHPLARAAVYAAIRPSRRAKLHSGAAGVVDELGASLRHWAAAATSPDQRLAGDLAQYAQREALRGAWAAAAEAFRSASALSVARDEREERMLRSLEALIMAGEVERARRLSAPLEGFAETARRDAVLAHLAFLSPYPHDAEPLFQSAWARCERGRDAALAATIAQRSAVHWILRLEDELAVKWSARALEVGETAPQELGTARVSLGEARGIHAVALAHLGRWRAARRALSARHDYGDEHSAIVTATRGWLALVSDDLDEAIAQLTAAAPATLRAGQLNFAAVTLTVLARAEYAAGAWDDAVVHSQRAVAIALDHEHSLAAFVWDGAILVPAARGDFAVADEYVREACSKVLHCVDRTAWLGVVRALPAAARGDHEVVLDSLEPLTTLQPRAGLDEPGFWPWQDLYADALVSVGRLADADAFLRHHEAIACARGRHSAIAKLARVRGRLEAGRGEPARAERCFQRALASGERVQMPYERALTELAHGTFLRAAGHAPRAATSLQRARDRLAALAAIPALRRCEHELAECGAPASAVTDTVAPTLTATERTVARLVAEGRGVQEIAAEFVVSVKTVEFHLAQIYAKLRVRSPDGG